MLIFLRKINSAIRDFGLHLFGKCRKKSKAVFASLTDNVERRAKASTESRNPHCRFQRNLLAFCSYMRSQQIRVLWPWNSEFRLRGAKICSERKLSNSP
jgi:hypothetical protein